MEFDHEFTVPTSVDEAWAVLLDLERVAPCIPGATLDSADGEEFAGRLRVKVGAMTITYRGGGRISSADAADHTVTIEGAAKEARGTGTAAATVQAHLSSAGDGTHVSVHTKLNVTGRPAQFGRGLLAEVGGKLIGRFAAALTKELQAPAEPAAEAGTESVPDAGPETVEPEPATLRLEQPRPHPVEPQAIDLLEVAGPSVLRRLIPVAAVVAALVVVRRLWRRRSRR